LISRLAASLAASLLVSCALAPEPRSLPSLASVPAAFEVTGRIAIRHGQRSDIAKLRWTRAAGSDLWVISSPLGNEVARIESGPRGTFLAQAGAEPVSAPDFPSLTERVLGVALDPVQLAQWLHGGRPADTGEWQVTIDEKQAAGEVDLARRITAARGDTVVRFVVDDYRALK
jgi:outer membrane biogenesis lipoprotein LolB